VASYRFAAIRKPRRSALSLKASLFCYHTRIVTHVTETQMPEEYTERWPDVVRPLNLTAKDGKTHTVRLRGMMHPVFLSPRGFFHPTKRQGRITAILPE